MDTAESADALALDPATFINDCPLAPMSYASCVASFREPGGVSAIEFEKLLWQTLRQLHERNKRAWDPSVSSDPDDAQFSFSFHGRAFFVVGMHAGSPRWTRRLAFPTLVFNAHEQFEDLRRSGRFLQVQRTIHSRDTTLQDSPNPALADYRAESEARARCWTIRARVTSCVSSGPSASPLPVADVLEISKSLTRSTNWLRDLFPSHGWLRELRILADQRADRVNFSFGVRVPARNASKAAWGATADPEKSTLSSGAT